MRESSRRVMTTSKEYKTPCIEHISSETVKDWICAGLCLAIIAEVIVLFWVMF